MNRLFPLKYLYSNDGWFLFMYFSHDLVGKGDKRTMRLWADMILTKLTRQHGKTRCIFVFRVL